MREGEGLLALTHLFIVILLVRQLELDRNEAMLGMLFGVLIDVDHLLGIPDFVSANGVENLTNTESLLTADVQWKSALHSPMAVLIVAPISASFRLAVPLLFWGTHVVLDTIQIEFLGIASLAEMAFLVLLGIALLLTEARAFGKNAAKGSGFVSWEAKRMMWVIASVNPFRRAEDRET